MGSRLEHWNRSLILKKLGGTGGFGHVRRALHCFQDCWEGYPTYKKAEGARGGPPEPPTCHPLARQTRACLRR